MGHSIAPIPPARYPSIPNKHVIFFHNLMSEIVADTIICFALSVHSQQACHLFPQPDVGNCP
jgi:hypothetical protein